MSLILNNAKPSGTLIISTSEHVQIGPFERPIEMTINEFCEMAMYVLLNKDLVPDDPRLKFMKDVKRLTKIRGFNFHQDPGSKRLGMKMTLKIKDGKPDP